MTEAPRGVTFLKEALAQRMGRPAAIRAVKGSLTQWFIFDPSFAVIQRGAGSNSRGYRSGIFVDNNQINFFNVHSRTPAMLLRKNLLEQPEALLNAAERTLHLRGTSKNPDSHGSHNARSLASADLPAACMGAIGNFSRCPIFGLPWLNLLWPLKGSGLLSGCLPQSPGLHMKGSLRRARMKGVLLVTLLLF